MAGLVIKPRSRILHGHDWVYATEILKAFGEPKDGDVVSLKDGRDHLLGTAIYNSKSQIIARRISRQRQDLDLDFFTRRIAQAVKYRERRGLDLRLCRMVWRGKRAGFHQSGPFRIGKRLGWRLSGPNVYVNRLGFTSF